MREREKEVQRTLATHMRDRDKEREQHKRDEAIQVDLFSIINLLAYLVYILFSAFQRVIIRFSSKF